MKSATFALICASFLTGCAQDASKAAQVLTAPDVVVYSRDQLTQAADEIDAGTCPMLAEFARDYCVMRDQSRALAGKKPVCTDAR